MDPLELLGVASEPADAAVVRAVEGVRVSIEAVNGELRKADPAEVKGCSVSVLRDGSWGVAAAEEPSADLVDKALAATGSGEASLPDDVPAAEGSWDWTGKIHPLDALEEVAETAVDVSSRWDYDIEVSCTVGAVRYELYASWGSRCALDLWYLSYGVTASDGGEEYSVRGGSRGVGIEGFLEDVEAAAEEAVSGLEDLVRAGRGPELAERVVVDPELLGVVVHEAFGHAVEGDLVARGESILAGRIGERVASGEVTVVDDPTVEGAFGSYPFDDEGVEARRTVLVRDGVLEGFLTDLNSSVELGLEPTGNGRVEAIGDHVQVRMSVTYVEPGDASKEELFEEAGDGAVLLVGSKGGQTDTVTGSFQFSAKLGYVIEGGEPSEPVKDVGLTGDTMGFLKGVRMLSEEVELHPGYCGKGGQLVPVADGGPYALVEGRFNLRSG